MDENKNALSEVYWTIRYLDENEKKEIPQKVIEKIKNHMNVYYKVSKEDILNRNISDTSKAILSVIYSEYLCSDEEKKKWDELDNLYMRKSKVQINNQNNIFKENIELNNSVNEEMQLVKIEQLSLIRKIIYKIKNIFGGKKNGKK